MAGEILPDSHMSVLHNLSNYLNELEEVMNSVDENRSTKSRSPCAVDRSRSKRQRHTLQTENKLHRKQRRHFTKACTDQSFSERQNSHPEGTRHDVVARKVVHHESTNSETSRYGTSKGSNYSTYASPRFRKAHHKKGKRFLKGNESRMIDEGKGIEDVVTMRIMQDEMKEMKEKLSAVVDTLSSVADALVKTVAQSDQPVAIGQSDLKELEMTAPQLYREKAAHPEVKSRRGGQGGFCCFGLRSVKSLESDSDYYRPRGSGNSQSKYDKEKRLGSSVSGDRVLDKTLSSESRNSRGCQNISGCYLIQRFLNRVKLLVF